MVFVSRGRAVEEDVVVGVVEYGSIRGRVKVEVVSGVQSRVSRGSSALPGWDAMCGRCDAVRL
jgi:hypothetical protein